MLNDFNKVFQEMISGDDRVKQGPPNDLEIFLSKQEIEFGDISLEDIEKQEAAALDAIRMLHSKIADVPIVYYIQLWTQNIKNDSLLGAKYCDMMLHLLECNLFIIKYNQRYFPVKSLSGTTLPLYNIYEPIHDIRKYKDWTIEKRERYVAFYLDFLNWLSRKTFLLVPVIEDPERKRTQKRALPFDTYIKIISQLSLRERILAKLFYLGGTRSLEDILSLEIENIGPGGLIHFSEGSVRYPPHVLQDLEDYLGERKSGYVFIGKGGERLDHTVPYRALKTVTQSMKLDPSFTFKDFTKNA